MKYRKQEKSIMKSKKGRPPVDTAAVMVRMPVEMIAAIDKLRREEEDLPTRPEMIRRLVEKSLKG